MNDPLNIILSKLQNIESRLFKIEGRPGRTDSKPDPLLHKALEIANKHDEVPSSLLQKELRIDVKRAEGIMDELEKAGYGECYFADR